MIEDYINGQKFKQICDFHFKSPNIKPYKKEYVVYSDMENYVDALSFISNNSPNKFVLVSHNGDADVRPTGLPRNLIHWYAQNVNYKHEKISAIPIGLENPQWHPQKMPMFLNAKEVQRENSAFCQFNPATKPDERIGLLNKVSTGKIKADYFSCLNGKDFDIYLNNLKRYKYCFCPRGNGIDTHRMWEALYMGCIPIVKRHITHKYVGSDLPILFVNEWEDFDFQDVEGNFNSKILTMQYWSEKIRGSIEND